MLNMKVFKSQSSRLSVSYLLYLKSYILNLKSYVLLFFVFCFLVIAYCLLSPLSASAQSLSLGITPPLIQITAKTPANLQTPLTIANESDQTVELGVRLMPFKQAPGDKGEVAYLTSSEASKAGYPLLFKNIQMRANNHNITTLTLAPKEQQKLNLHLGLTKDIPKGDYYFSVVFVRAAPDTVSKPDATEQNISNTTGGIATNVLLSVNPSDKTKGKIEQFSSPFLIQAGPLPLTVKVKNESDHVTTIKGVIFIKNLFGQTVGRIDLPATNILSQSSRFIPDFKQATGTLPTKTQSVLGEQIAAIWPEQFLFGPYQATLTLALSDTGPILSKNTYFFALPIQAILGFLAALLLVLTIHQRLKRKLKAD